MPKLWESVASIILNSYRNGGTMKVCKYCGTQNDNNVAFCTQCGANSFSYKCVNCGTVFDTPHCPMCGVSADAMPRYCPNCGRKTFSNCCPDCGTNLVVLPTSRNIYASHLQFLHRRNPPPRSPNRPRPCGSLISKQCAYF